MTNYKSLAGLTVMLFALSACAVSPDPGTAAKKETTQQQTAYGALNAYTKAAQQESALIHGGRVTSPVTIARMKQLDNSAYAALQPITSAAQAGQPITGQDQGTFNAAMAAFTSYLATASTPAAPAPAPAHAAPTPISAAPAGTPDVVVPAPEPTSN